MDFNKIPRWALILIASVGLGACGLLVSTARADLYKFKTIAYQAKNISDDNTQSILDLKGSVDKVQQYQETFRREYRDDRIRDLEQLQKMEERIIRAVKA